MDIKMSNQVVFWCVCIGYAEFYSRCILVEDGGIFVTLLAHRKIPGVIPQVAAFQLHLLICSENQQCPKPSSFPQQFKAQENYLELVHCTKSSMKDELLETWQFVLIQTQRCDGSCGNNWSSPEAKQCYVWAAAAWTEKGERSHSRTGEASKTPLSYLWPFGQTHILSTPDIRQSCF